MLKKLFAIIFAIALLLSCTANISAAGSDKGTPLSEEMQVKENDALIKYNKMIKAWAGDREAFSDMDVDFPDFY